MDRERGIRETSVETHAFSVFMEHTNGGRDRSWALGPGTTHLQMQIIGVPRPDVLCRDNYGDLDWRVETLDGSRRFDVQKWVYEQLGRMTGLTRLSLGAIIISWKDVDMFNLDHTSNVADQEDELEAWGQRCKLVNLQCLVFSLESGLHLLSGLEELEELDVRSTAHRSCAEELDWMYVHWPELKQINGLVTKRVWAEDDDQLMVRDEVKGRMRRHPDGIGCSYHDETSRYYTV
ncbi:hypothetical protein BGW39_007620 [Mortierella sp. 14UC]|nr:hypothetical protein BGW39_007620 [Mortierella sp. 14UC]